MPLARWQATIVDDAGDIQPLASIEVRRESDNALVALYSDRAGTISIGNPFLADAEGFAAFHAAGGAYKVTATLGAFARIFRYVPLGTAAELDQEQVVGIPATYLDTDVTLAANSDSKVASQKATKSYVDNVAQGLDVKPSVKCATTANITLSGEQTLDGILTSASRVLVKNQSTAAQNGIYVSAAGAWARATDNDHWLEVPGAFTFVEQGTVNGNTGWTCTADAGGTIGVTAMPWTQFSGAGVYTGTGGILLTGTQFSINPAVIDIADPGADRIWFWDDSASKWTALTPNASFEINGTTLRLIETHGIALSDETTAITTGTNKATMSLPYAFTVTSVYATLNTASSSGIPTVDINEAGTTILSTKLTIDASEKTSATAAAAPVISDAAIAANAEIGFDIDVAGTGAKGLKVFIQGYRT